MSTYISVAEEEAAEPIELPTEDDGTGSDQGDQCQHVPSGLVTPQLHLAWYKQMSNIVAWFHQYVTLDMEHF